MSKNTKLLIIGCVGLSVLGVMFVCGLIALGLLAGPFPAKPQPPRRTPAAAWVTEEPTEATSPLPIDTPMLTDTPLPTDTPVSTAPPFEEIRAQMDDMTEAQWNKYQEDLKGLEVADWAGWVEDVNEKLFGGYELWVDMDSPSELLSVQDVTFDIPEDIALQFQKDQQVSFSGQIDTVLNILGSCQVHLVNVTVSSQPYDTPTPSVAAPTVPADTPVPPGSPKLEVLSHQSYTDVGWFHIVGEVRNNSDIPMEYIKIVATLYDNANNVVGTDFTYTELDVIPPGGKAPFETGTDEFDGIAQYKLQVQGDLGALPRQDIVILSHKHYEDAGWLHVIGEVQNTGDSPAEYVKIVITLYDAVGNVVGMDFTYTELDIVQPGGTSPFETGTDHWPNFDHYEIQVQAQ